ncbi:MAG: ATP-binding protein [Gammaproteobacteria bacterium]
MLEFRPAGNENERQTGPNTERTTGTELILNECCEQINRLFEYETLAFMLVDEQDQSFRLQYCEPGGMRAYIQTEVDRLIEAGFFSWALGQNKPVIETASDEKDLVLYTLSTKSRIRGMFIGATCKHRLLEHSDAFNLLTVILSGTSDRLENNELYQCIRQQNRHLEEIIRQRTSELENARIAAEQANEAKSQFLANISHEIRTPLTAILGYADLIRYGQLSAEEEEQAVKDILKSSSHLSDIINDILDISKIEADRLEIELLPTHLFHLLHEVAAIVKGKAKEKALDFEIDYLFPLPEFILTDPTRLRQILLNLCNNAVKFTHAGEIRLAVNCESENRRIRFEVIDTGIGIPREQQAKLFDKFVQADASTTRCYGGSGLGLTISKQLAHMLGGTITLQSEPGRGSRFTVTVDSGPIEPGMLIDGLERLPDEEGQTDPWSLSHRLLGRVLLVEDNINNQQLISLFLSKAGISVEIVDNGNDAIEKALVDSYDVILMDMQMPGMSGIEATRLLRDVGYGGVVIALTANATVEIKRQCHDAGFDDFLSKPIEVDTFFNTLSRYLKTSPTVDESINFNDPDFQAILLEFVESLPQTLADLENEFRRQNWPALKSLAHQLKGVAGGYGYPELGKTAGLLEAALDRGDTAGAADLMAELRNAAVFDR